ncbi:hypothetical protein [Haloarchaeobius sp. TZWWS8]|uniref:hypothetical protein n=1 Tax=Haloarchaeobius sp. TZWWS8 TaxID=3446121 RepID=UPI003EC00787
MSDDGDSDSQPRDTMRQRANVSSLKLRILMDANRLLVAAGIGLFVFVALVFIGVAHPSDVHSLLSDGDPIETLFQAFVTAIITGVTLVLTLNQLVLSQELGAVGDQRERMQGAMEFRGDVADTIDAPVAPAEPSAFLRSLVAVSRARANAVKEAVSDADNDDLREQVEQVVDGLVENANGVEESLDGANFGAFDVLFAALDYNYSWKIYAVRRVKHDHQDSLTEEAEEAFEDLVEALELFGPAREHIKTLYFQWELVDLSRAMSYAAVPALVVTSAMLVFFDADAPAFAGTILGIDKLLLLLAVTTTIAVVPFALMLSYVLRIATVTKRTLSIGPLILRETDRTDEVDWD